MYFTSLEGESMKAGLWGLLICAGLLAGCSSGAQYSPRPAEEPFAVLDAYGIWLDVAGLGRVWQPTVATGWQPFTDGCWAWTDRGWLWVSDEPYAWVVYHYGYWDRWGAAGWVWVPGYEWSPARVRWIAGDDVIGWAPMPAPQANLPQAYEPGSENVWVFVPAEHFTRTNVGSYRTSTTPPGSDRQTMQNQQRPPDVGFIQRATKQSISTRRTEKEEVRRGERTLTRVRVVDGEARGVVPSRPQTTAPAAAPVTPSAPRNIRGEERTPMDTKGGIPSTGATIKKPDQPQRGKVDEKKNPATPARDTVGTDEQKKKAGESGRSAPREDDRK